MVAVFLRTEVASPRFGAAMLAILRRDGRDRRIIDRPELAEHAATIGVGGGIGEPGPVK